MIPQRLLLELVGAALLIAGFAWFVHHERQLGIDKERQAVEKAVTAAQDRMRDEYETKAKTSQEIGDTYHEVVSAPVSAPPVVRVVRVRDACPDRMPEATTAASDSHEGTDHRAADPIDIGAPLVTIGRDADAQIAALQSYITRVCLN